MRKMIWRALRAPQDPWEYRKLLFEEIQVVRGQLPIRRILEISSKDGPESRRLLSLNPEQLVLVDLPEMKPQHSETPFHHVSK